MRPNFELISELQTLTRRDFPVANVNYVKPYDSSAIIDGEWLNLVNYKLDRGAANGDSYLVFPVHTEKGRYDVQAIQKVSVLYFGMYEAETAVMDPTGLAVGDKLMVGTLGAGAAAAYQGKRGLLEVAAAAGVTVPCVGIVTKAPANGRVRFVHFGIDSMKM